MFDTSNTNEIDKSLRVHCLRFIFDELPESLLDSHHKPSLRSLATAKSSDFALSKNGSYREFPRHELATLEKNDGACHIFKFSGQKCPNRIRWIIIKYAIIKNTI